MSYPIHGMVERARRAYHNLTDLCDACDEARKGGDETCAEHAPLLVRARELQGALDDGPESDPIAGGER